jgi:predicted lipoprotein with Yx(FWY)xxD motif
MRPRITGRLATASIGVSALIVGGCSAAADGSLAQRHTAISTRTNAAGTYLTDDGGRTLYLFTADTEGHSSCAGACAAEWIPFTARDEPAPAGFAAGARIGTITRGDGRRQASYAWHPLYYFAGDTARGQTFGQGLSDFGGMWFTVTPTGTATSRTER